MNNYKYVFMRRYPFYRKRKLTETELIMRNMTMLFSILPVVLFISTTYNILRKLKVVK